MSCLAWAQTTLVPPVAVFDLHTQELAGPGSSVTAFVARDSHLYFGISSSRASLELQTTPEGVAEHINAMGAGPISGLDVNGAGETWILTGSSHLTRLGSDGRFQTGLEPGEPLVSFALAGDVPLGVDAHGEVKLLDRSGGGPSLAAYDPSGKFFGTGRGLGILYSQTSTLQTFGFEGGDVTLTSSVSLGRILSARQPIAAAADGAGGIYLLGARRDNGTSAVIECDEQGNPAFLFEFRLAAAFNPQMIGIQEGHAWLVDPAGQVAVYALNRERAQTLHSAPRLLTDPGAFQSAVRKAGYRGRVTGRVDINTQGLPERIQIQSPAFLANIPEIADAAGAWRFQPATREARPTTSAVQFDIDVF